MKRKSIDEQLLEAEQQDRLERTARAQEMQLTALRWEMQKLAYELQKLPSPVAQEASVRALDIVALLVAEAGE